MISLLNPSPSSACIHHLSFACCISLFDKFSEIHWPWSLLLCNYVNPPVNSPHPVAPTPCSHTAYPTAKKILRLLGKITVYKTENAVVGIRRADHETPSIHKNWQPQKLAITSPTSGGCSVGTVRSRAKATQFTSTWQNIAVHNAAHSSANRTSILMQQGKGLAGRNVLFNLATKCFCQHHYTATHLYCGLQFNL
jgi:hypothetical protein